MVTEQARAGDAMAAGVVSNNRSEADIDSPFFGLDFVCVDADGNEKWRESVRNLVTTEGKNDLIDKYFKGSAYTAAWYLGLKGTGSPVAGDTLASHGGWSEINPYTGNRPAITFGTTASGSNTATAVSFPITATATVYGAFITSVNSGTSGKLYSATDFSVARSVASGDTVNVTPTVSAS